MTIEEMNSKINELDKQSKNLDNITKEQDSDEFLQKQLNKFEVVGGFSSKVYKGRNISVSKMADNSMIFTLNSLPLKKSMGTDYRPIIYNLSEETFVILLEAMEFADKSFQVDRQSIIKKLVEGKKESIIEFETKITVGVSF